MAFSNPLPLPEGVVDYFHPVRYKVCNGGGGGGGSLGFVGGGVGSVKFSVWRGRGGEGVVCLSVFYRHFCTEFYDIHRIMLGFMLI